MITKTLDRMAAFVQRLDAGPPPMDAPYLGEPIPPATEQLRTNLERAATAYLQREQTLQREIADREAELADVRRARDAATAGLLELEPTDPLEEEINGGLHEYTEAERVPLDAAEMGYRQYMPELATGAYLDNIAGIWSEIRSDGESDASLRARVVAKRAAAVASNSGVRHD